MKIGFFGAGNMGEAMIGGILREELFPAENIYVNTRSKETMAKLVEKYKINMCLDKSEMVKAVDIIVLAVKPNVMDIVLDEIAQYVTKEQIVVSIAAGYTIGRMEEKLSKAHAIIRTMPNIPVLVKEGMTAMAGNKMVSEENLKTVGNIFNSLGRSTVVEERLMGAVTGLSGSSPAYTYIFIEALADGGVREGLSREQAYEMAAQSVLGAAKMVLETGLHPGELKDQVCSPGGTAIEAVEAIERNGFRAATIDAVHVSTEKSNKM